jgi:uncharacterized protein (DUF433 family)
MSRRHITPGVRSGKPSIVGTRITPTDVLEYLAGGMSVVECHLARALTCVDLWILLSCAEMRDLS